MQLDVVIPAMAPVPDPPLPPGQPAPVPHRYGRAQWVKVYKTELDRGNIVVLDNETSEWLAWEGSGDFGGNRGGSINGPVAPRQPGSALKTFTYALAVNPGTYTSGTMAPCRRTTRSWSR